MNKETYKEYVRQRLHEEYYNRKEKKAMRKAATAQLATDAAVNMGEPRRGSARAWHDRPVPPSLAVSYASSVGRCGTTSARGG